MNDHDFSSPTSDETHYFSALEEIQPDEQAQRQKSIDSLDSEHYYTRLRLDDMTSRTYFKIEIKDDKGESVYRFDIDRDNSNCSNRVHIIQNESRNNTKKKESNFDDPFEPRFTSTRIDEFLDDLTDDLKTNFENKVKNSKFKHDNLDQVIEDTLDETGFEDMTDSLIHSVAAESQSQSKLSLHEDQLNDTFISTQNEMTLIKHSFHLINKVNLTSLGQTFENFMIKLEILSETAIKIVRPVARVFRDLFDLNFPGAMSNLNVVSFTDRWNVIKNMLYYAARIILLKISSLYRSDSIVNSSIKNLFNQIISYVKNFQYLHY